MYLRHTIRKKDGKVHRYWCLVRSVRVGRRVIQQTVAQLGELDAQGRVEALTRSCVGDDGGESRLPESREKLPDPEIGIPCSRILNSLFHRVGNFSPTN